LHGWVDDRIEDWYQAHQAAAPGEVIRHDHKGVPWFRPGRWVQAADPFDWPDDEHHGGGHDEGHAVTVMLEVLEIVRNAFEAPAPDVRVALDRLALDHPPGVTSFLRWIEPPMGLAED
jgi:hypothetical protein